MGYLANDFSKIVHNGYYFDCCVDLYFFDENDKLLFKIITPEKGLKPEINISGAIISSSYVVSSSVSIKNLSYEVDIDKVAKINADMYYSGLQSELARKSLGLRKIAKGHAISFSVLFAEQEGEPPDRYVRFNCSIAAMDYTHLTAPIKFGSKSYTIGGNIIGYADDRKVVEKTVTDEEKSKKTWTVRQTLLGYLITLAKCYNANPNVSFSAVTPNAVFIEKTGGVPITKIKYRGIDAKKLKMAYTSSTTNFDDLREQLQEALCMITDYNNKISITFNPDGEKGVLQLDTSLAAMDYYGKGVNENYLKYFYNDKGEFIEDYQVWGLRLDGEYEAVTKKRRTVQEVKYDKIPIYEIEEKDVYLGDTPENAIPINFVKSAYKNQKYMNLKVLFDDRIYPDCWCKMAGRLLMGKTGLGSGNITSFYKQDVLFQVIGEIKFSFSTISGGTMEFAAIATTATTEDSEA